MLAGCGSRHKTFLSRQRHHHKRISPIHVRADDDHISAIWLSPESQLRPVNSGQSTQDKRAAWVYVILRLDVLCFLERGTGALNAFAPGDGRVVTQLVAGGLGAEVDVLAK